MFDKFGEFDSSEAINKAAEEKFNAGDMDAIRGIAEENGIDKEDAEDFISGVIEELTTPILAAVGKLQLECTELKLKGVLLDWAEEIKSMCVIDESFARAVRKKGKDLAGYIAKTAEYGYEHRAIVDKRIVAKTNQIKKIIGSHEFSIGIPDKKTRKELAIKYYLE